MTEIEFKKYKTRGAYHWDQISRDPFKRNTFVLARYNSILTLTKCCFAEGMKGRKVLDVGCGDGVLSYLISRDGAIVSGVDNSEIAIQYARRKTQGLGIEFRQSSAYDLPWEDKFFDAVVSSDVIEHVEDVDRYLSEIHRVVKPEGSVVISTPIRYTETPLDKMHVVEWFPEEFKRLITQIFPNSRFYQTHPLFWYELRRRSIRLNVLINILSLVKNPFEGFSTTFRYKVMQYSVSQKS